MSERRFPIYRTDVRWIYDSDETPEQKAKYHLGDPGEGRFWNSTGWCEMFREEQDTDEMERKAREEWWPKHIDTPSRFGENLKPSAANPSEPTITVKLSHYEEWVCTWFQHETFDDGQTDAEALRSFGDYVHRHAFYQDWPHDDATDADLKARGIEHRVCLMGAEDRWRWSGSGEDGDNNVNTDPPCRCKHCKAQGKVRIGH